MPLAIATLTIIDADGDLSAIRVHFMADDADTLATLESDYIKPFWDVVAPLILGALADVQVSFSPPFRTWDTYIDTPQVIADVEEKAVFQFQTATRHSSFVSIPTIYEWYFTPAYAGKEIDVTNGDVQAFIVFLTEDVGSGGMNAVDSHGDDISRFIEGHQAFVGRKT